MVLVGTTITIFVQPAHTPLYNFTVVFLNTRVKTFLLVKVPPVRTNFFNAFLPPSVPATLVVFVSTPSSRLRSSAATEDAEDVPLPAEALLASPADFGLFSASKGRIRIGSARII